MAGEALHPEVRKRLERTVDVVLTKAYRRQLAEARDVFAGLHARLDQVEASLREREGW